MDFFAQPPPRADTEAVADDQHADQQLGVDREAADRAAVRSQMLADAGQVDERIDGSQEMIGWDLPLQAKAVEQRLLLAETLHRSGRTDEGLHALADALAFEEETEERCWEAEIHRLQGELLLSLATPDPTEACYRSAIEVAQAQCAKMLELRAAASLARLWQNQGKGTEAYELLAPVYGWFSEGFSTSDLKEARLLLDAVPARHRSA